MAQKIAERSQIHAHNRRQALALLLLGLGFLVVAVIVHLVLGINPSTYPLGVLLLGLGMLVGAALNPARLVSASLLTTFLGLATFLTFKHLVPGGQLLALYILAIGIALLGIALAARRGYVGAGAVTPACIVIAVGIIEYLLALGMLPGQFVPLALSLWLPGVGLLLIGLLYWFTSNQSDSRPTDGKLRNQP